MMGVVSWIALLCRYGRGLNDIMSRMVCELHAIDIILGVETGRRPQPFTCEPANSTYAATGSLRAASNSDTDTPSTSASRTSVESRGECLPHSILLTVLADTPPRYANFS